MSTGKSAFLLLNVLLGLAPFDLRAESFVTNREDRQRIEQALPSRALAPSAKPRHLLIFTRNVGYGGHPSMAYANEAFTLMGRKTGAFETVVSDEPEVFSPNSLRRFDAVFFNNTVGNCFTNTELRQSLLEFVTGGGGLLGVHGTTVAFMRWPGAVEDWPEFGYLIGARGANHKDSDEHVWLKLDDSTNPITQVFAKQGFDYRDEFFRPQGTYSRQRVRVLLSIDTSKTDPNKGQPRGDCFRPDNDYAAAWIRNYGRGRVFYCTIAHNPSVFWDPQMLQFYLAAVQFALGDLPCPTTPSARLSPEILAQERLGWRLTLQAGRVPETTFFDDIDQASKLGLPWVSSSSSQRVSRKNPHTLGPGLSDTELRDVRLKLENAGIRLISHRLHELPTSSAGWRQLFKFGRKMGHEAFISESLPEAMDLVAGLCRESGIHFALGTSPNKSGRQSLNVEALLRLCRDRCPELGATVNLSEWSHASADPTRASRALQNRLLAVQLGADPLLAQQLEPFLKETSRARLKPIFFVENANLAVRSTIELFNASCLKLTQ